MRSGLIRYNVVMKLKSVWDEPKLQILHPLLVRLIVPDFQIREPQWCEAEKKHSRLV